MDPELIEKREEFREHLTLGIVRALEKVPHIQDVVLAEHQPSDNIAITSWEQVNSSYTSTLYIRVGSIGRDFIVLLTQCRHMNPDELWLNNFLIQTTFNYLWASEV